MAEFAALTIKRIKELPVVPVQSHLDARSTLTDLLHPDSFVAETELSLRDLLSDFDMKRRILGRRFAQTASADAPLPIGIAFAMDIGIMRITSPLTGCADEVIDIRHRTNKPFRSYELAFAMVDMAVLPPIGGSQFVSTATEDDAAVLVALGDAAAVKVIPNLKPAVTVPAYTAAIMPPGAPLFLQGARSMLIRPTLI